MLKAAILMLSRNGLGSQAAAIENAWLTTLEDGIHTRDIIGDHTRALVGTENFADAIIDRLGDEPKTLAAAPRSMPWSIPEPEDMPRVSTKQELAGVDIFVCSDDRYPVSLGDRLSQSGGPLVLDMVTNRGVKVWPDGNPLTFCTDHWRCRLLADGDDRVSFADVISQLQTVHQAGFQVIKSEHLYRFDGKPGCSLGQGQ
jgi:isocitrate dehydrogenase